MKIRIVAAALAAFFMLPFIGSAAYAAEFDLAELDDPAVASLVEQVTEDEAPEETPDIPATEGPIVTDSGITAFTPSGTGTVVDYATDADGKVFYTIITPAENVFYLVIDRQRGQENVYFLNAVTEADLLALAEIPATPDPAPTVTEQPTAPAEPEPEQAPAPEQGGGNMGMIILVVAVVLVGGGAGYYFKIYKPKQEKADAGDDYDYSADEGDPYGEDEQEDDSLPWYDGDEGAEPDGDAGEDE